MSTSDNDQAPAAQPKRMSTLILAMKQVRDDETLTAPEKLMWLLLADRGDNDRGLAYPSHTSLAKSSSVDARTVCTVLGTLDDKGWITRQVRDLRQTTIYTVELDPNRRAELKAARAPAAAERQSKQDAARAKARVKRAAEKAELRQAEGAAAHAFGQEEDPGCGTDRGSVPIVDRYRSQIGTDRGSVRGTDRGPVGVPIHDRSKVSGQGPTPEGPSITGPTPDLVLAAVGRDPDPDRARARACTTSTEPDPSELTPLARYRWFVGRFPTIKQVFSPLSQKTLNGLEKKRVHNNGTVEQVCEALNAAAHLVRERRGRGEELDQAAVMNQLWTCCVQAWKGEAGHKVASERIRVEERELVRKAEAASWGPAPPAIAPRPEQVRSSSPSEGRSAAPSCATSAVGPRSWSQNSHDRLQNKPISNTNTR